MKKFYLFLLGLLLAFSSLTGQSTWLTPEAGYISRDIIPDKAFSCHDISGNNLYAIDSDGLYGYDLTTLQQTHDFGKAPADYSGWVSFVTADPDGTKIWVGYTVSGLTDDRIYSVDIATGTWTHVATFPGNFDMEIVHGNYYVSGLNTEGWDGVNDVNCISLLDLSGNDQHQKLIEVGGNSSGLAVDAAGNVYNAKYDPSGSTLMYQWAAADLANVITATDGSFLTLDDGIILTSMPGNGPYDCDVDDAGNMLFNCNDFTGGSFMAVWNGNTGEAENYEKLGVYGGSSFAWFSMLKATGDITADGKAYMINFGDPMAEIRLSKAPEINRPLSDLLLPVNAPQTIMDLSEYFTAKEGETIHYEVSTETNSILASANIDESSLSIDYLADATGTAEVTVTATSSGDEVNISFNIELRDIDYSNGVFAVNEDWFGHSNGTVNYLTSDGQFVYRAYRQENSGETLGTTSQFGTIYGNNFYLMSKQGTRMVVANAASMQKATSFDELPDGEDGRSFVGVTPQKGYISTTDGVYTFDIASMALGEKISGTSGETGNMLRAGDYVFAVTQSGVFVIDAETDELQETISDGTSTYAGLTQSIDGSVWIGAGSRLVKVDPYTLDTEDITLPSGVEVPAPWFAWTANSFCASTTENALFWAKPGGWSGSNIIFKYIIGDETSLNEPFITIETGMELYGGGLRVHPVTNQVYATAKKSGWGDNSLTNTLYVFDGTTGDELSAHPMEPYYWFPALPVFPDAYAPEFALSDLDFAPGEEAVTTDIDELVSDVDNNDAAILLEVTGNSDNAVASAEVVNGQLIVSPLSSEEGQTTISLMAISNGKVAEGDFKVTVTPVTSVSEAQSNTVRIYPNPFDNYFIIDGANITGRLFRIINLNGRVVKSGRVESSSERINCSDLASGIYMIIIDTENGPITLKAFKK